MSIMSFFLKPIVLTTIYVKTTGNVCGSENTPLKTVVTTVFFNSDIVLFKENSVYLTSIYVKTAGNVFEKDNICIKNCSYN